MSFAQLDNAPQMNVGCHCETLAVMIQILTGLEYKPMSQTVVRLFIYSICQHHVQLGFNTQ